MFLARRHRTRFAKLAAAALLLAALAPALAQGLAQAQNRWAPWRVLCAAGSDPAGAAAAGGGERAAAQLLQHCALCQANADAALPPAHPRLGLRHFWPSSAALPRLAAPARASRLQAWLKVRPRAPPVQG